LGGESLLGALQWYAVLLASSTDRFFTHNSLALSLGRKRSGIDAQGDFAIRLISVSEAQHLRAVRAQIRPVHLCAAWMSEIPCWNVLAKVPKTNSIRQ
jgi:hypothetical protein